MTVLNNARQILDRKDGLLEAANISVTVLSIIQSSTDEEGFTLADFVKLSAEELTSFTVGQVIDILQEANDDLLTDARDLQTKLNNAANGVDNVEDTAKDGEVATLIAGLFPGVGPVITRLQLNDLLGVIDDEADPLQRELQSLIDKNAAFISAREEEKETLDQLETAAKTIELIYGTVDLALGFYNEAADEVGQTTTSAASSLGALATDSRSETAFDALEGRFAAKTAAVTETVDQANETVAPIRQAVATVPPALQSGLDKVASLSTPLNALTSATSAFGPFLTAVGSFASPVNSFLDTLEEGPGLLPSIPRSAIDRVLDFLDGLSGALNRVFDFFFGDLLAPLERLADSLFSRLVDLSPLNDPTELLQNIVDEALSALNIISPVLDQFQASLTSLIDAPTVGLEEFVADPGDLRETFFGADTDDVIVGLAPVAALATADIAGAVLNGAGGNDQLTGTAAEDLLIGGDDDDLLTGLGANDVLVGGAGDDTLNGGAGDDVIDGGAGARDIAVFDGALADFTITEQDFVIRVAGADGTDDVVGVETFRFTDQDVAARLFLPEDFPGAVERGGATDDEFEGGDGGDSLSGGAGKDNLKGGGGKDLLKGGGDDDRISGGSGEDTLNGGGGDDNIRGGGGADRIKGGGGDDTLKGGGGADNIKGNGGNDELRGGGGADTLEGGRGDDTLLGNNGSDRFVFGNNDGDNVIQRFQQGQDAIEFKSAGDFDDLTIETSDPGALISFRNTTVLVEGQSANAFDEDDFIF